MNSINISVIIPSYNSADLLIRCLNALTTNTYPQSKYEVILIDDGSTDNTKNVVNEYIKKSNMTISFYKKKNQGPGMARNVGLKKAKADIIAFTDADCIPDKNWLSTIDKYIRINGETLINGKTYSEDTLIFPWIIAPAGHIGVTANLAYKKTAAPDVCFDKEYLKFLGQDTDFIYRIEDHGIKMKIVDSMKVLHPANTLSYKAVKKRAIAKRNEVKLYKQYGERVKGSIHPFFQPVIVKRFSAFCLAITSLLLVMVVLIITKQLLILLFMLTILSIIFITFGYKFLVYNHQDEDKITYSKRIKTLLILIWYTPWYFYGRILGSIENQYLLI